jgi:hypothetical protein
MSTPVERLDSEGLNFSLAQNTIRDAASMKLRAALHYFRGMLGQSSLSKILQMQKKERKKERAT